VKFKSPGKHAMAFVLITVLLDIIGFGMILPVMPALITELTGESLNQAAIYGGWLMFVYALMQFIFAPILGNLSDAFGRRPLFLITLFSLMIDYLIIGFSQNLLWLFIGRVLVGISGASFGIATAYISDVSTKEKKAQNFGLIGAAFGVGFIVGPALGGLLGEYGARVPFFAAAALAAINFIYGAIVLPETLAPEKRRPFQLTRANPIGVFYQMKKYPVVIGLMGVLFLYQLAHDSLPSTWTYYTMFKFNWTARDVGLSLALVGLMTGISQGGLIRVAIKKFGEEITLFIGLMLGAVGYYGFAFAMSGSFMMAWIVPWSLMTLATPSLRALMSHNVGDDAQGELAGAMTSLSSFAAIMGPLLMSRLFFYFSGGDGPLYFPGAAFLLSGVLLTLGLLWAIITLKKNKTLNAVQS
jgi:DHA1 family tetracycline resistance protein-like MFS transporter